MFRKIWHRPGICSVMVILMLAGCTPEGNTHGWIHYSIDPPEHVTSSDLFDMKLQHAETSPIPGASARVLAPPPGVVYAGAPVSACVTEAGYCPLAAQTEPGQNCLCTATAGRSQGVYGGATGIPPKYNYKTNPNVW